MPEGIHFCPRCGRSLPVESAFCPYCGLDIRFLGSSNPESISSSRQSSGALSKLTRIVGAWSSLAVTLMLLANVILALWGASLVVPKIGDLGVVIFIIVPQVFELFTIMGAGAVLMYLLFLAAVTLSFLYLIYEGRNKILPELKGNKSENPSAIYAIGTIFCALLSFQLIYYFILLSNQDVSTPGFVTMPLWAQLYFLLEASVWEEIVSRVLLIGVPILIIYSLQKTREEKCHRYLLGGFEMDRLAVGLILFSSLFFGLAHYGSWDIFKILPSFLAGIGMGYLFVRYGLYASIMLHFAFDYLGLHNLVFDSLSATLLIGLLTLFWAAAGLPFIFVYAKAGIENILNQKLEFKKKEKVHENDDAYVYIPRPICPQCGRDHIRVLETDYECMNCGKRF